MEKVNIKICTLSVVSPSLSVNHIMYVSSSLPSSYLLFYLCPSFPVPCHPCHYIPLPGSPGGSEEREVLIRWTRLSSRRTSAGTLTRWHVCYFGTLNQATSTIVDQGGLIPPIPRRDWHHGLGLLPQPSILFVSVLPHRFPSVAVTVV